MANVRFKDKLQGRIVFNGSQVGDMRTASLLKEPIFMYYFVMAQHL